MHEEDHGHSVAAWTGVIILILASALVCVGVFFNLMWANIVGAVLVPVGVGAWYALNRAGFGETSHGEAVYAKPE